MCLVSMLAHRKSMFGRIRGTFDRLLYSMGQRMTRFIIDNRFLISVLVIGFIVWAIVFNAAVADYTNTSVWNSRTSWLGPFPDPGIVNIFGFRIPYQPEGYSDYSFYYVHWGYNFLFGTMPYTPSFGYLEMTGITNENGAHLFPPFTSFLYGTGIWLGNLFGWANWGIGLLIAGFGFLTALPIYGVAKELSSNRRVGEVAALTYLLNPLVLYHTDFLWFNPAPFVFFFFAGFFMLIRERWITGSLLIVSAALFKQTAWFLGIPLIVYLLVRRREKPQDVQEPPIDSNGSREKPKPRPVLEVLSSYFNLRRFAVGVIIVVSFVGAVMLPFLIATPDFLNYWSLALGSFSFEGNFVDLPPYNVPERIQVLLIMAGMPNQAEILDTIIVSGGPMVFAVTVFFGVMLLKDRYIGEERLYLRRILFMTFMMMLLINIVGARGVFKYYFVATVPFFSIFSSARMIRGSGEHVPFSASMAILPIAFSLMILIPDRNFYLAYVIVIFILYLLAPLIDRFYGRLKPLSSVITSKIPISRGTITLDSRPPSTRKAIIAAWVSRTSSFLVGASLFVYGLLISTWAFGVDMVVGLSVILVAGIAITLGLQLVSISLSLNNPSKLNDALHSFSYTAMATVLVFGIGTYILGWNVYLYSERQFLIFSSIFISIWALSLGLDMKASFARKYGRIIADLLLLCGLLLGVVVWHPLSNPLIGIIGTISISAMIVHLILVITALLHRNESLSIECATTSMEETASSTN
ncbi:MAG: hypothetical protein ACFFCP_05970 [Promethearchaeota archaeon]